MAKTNIQKINRVLAIEYLVNKEIENLKSKLIEKYDNYSNTKLERIMNKSTAAINGTMFIVID